MPPVEEVGGPDASKALLTTGRRVSRYPTIWPTAAVLGRGTEEFSRLTAELPVGRDRRKHPTRDGYHDLMSGQETAMRTPALSAMQVAHSSLRVACCLNPNPVAYPQYPMWCCGDKSVARELFGKNLSDT